MADPDFIPVKKTADPDFIPVAKPAAPIPPDRFAEDRAITDAWAAQHPILGPIARFLVAGGQNAANAITDTPGALYHAIVDPPTLDEAALTPEQRIASRLGGRQAIDAASDYASGKVTPKGALSVLPEALGTGLGQTAGGAVYAKLGEVAPEIAGKVTDAVIEKIPPSVRAGVRSANAALKNPTAAGGTGAAVGATIGHATGVPYAPEIGGVLGGIAGRKYLPKLTIPGEGFGLPSRVTGGPVSAPPYIAAPETPAVFPGAPLPEAIGPEVAQAHPIGTGAQPVVEPSEALGSIPRAQSEVLNDRLRQPQPTSPLDRLRDQPIAPAQPDFEPIRPSIERITPRNSPPEEGEGGMATGGESPAPQTPTGGVQAFRARSVGEAGIPYEPTSRAQATMSQPEAESYVEGREAATGQPQQVIGVDLGKTPGFSTMAGPRGNDWVKFHGPVGEDAVTPINVPPVGSGIMDSAAYTTGPGPSIQRGPIPGSAEDLAESRGLEEQVRNAADEEGRKFASQQKREWFARNQPGATKGELTGQPEKPVKYTKTPLSLKIAGQDVPADADLVEAIKASTKKAKQERGQ